MFFDRLPAAGYVCAHRGARSHAPENTMLAARIALESGADYWETDVQMTADGMLVIFHDDVISRTTDIAERSEFADREPWPIASFFLKELDRIDAGSWFGVADPYGTIASGSVTQAQVERMKGASIPTFSEALLFSRQNDFPINVEIKDQKHMPGDLSIVGEVLGAIRDHEAEDLVLISSFNHDYLAEANRLAPHIPLAALVEDRHPGDVAAHLKSLGATAYHPDRKLVDDELVRTLTQQGIRVAPWTVNDMDEARRLIDAGCFGIITDYTHALRHRLAANIG